MKISFATVRREGKVRLTLVPTDDMPADMLTKALNDATFEKHRRRVMNLKARKDSVTDH